MLYQLSYTPQKKKDSSKRVKRSLIGAEKKRGRGWVWPSPHHIKGAWARKPALLNKRTFISKVACFHSLKILSKKEGQRGILKLLSLTPSTRRLGRLSFRPPYGSP